MTWPFENDTRKVIHSLAKSSLKSGKMRNILVIITISLSIALMSGLALYTAFTKTANNRQLETMQHVFFYEITEEKGNTLRGDRRIAEVRLTKYGKRSEVENYVILPIYIEQSDGNIQGSQIIKGKYPLAKNEIAVDASYLELRGGTIDIGDPISLSFYDGTQEIFVLSGLTDTGSTSEVYPVYFSKEYAESGSQLKDSLFVAAAQIQDGKTMSANDFLDTIHSIGMDYGIERPNIGENSTFVQSLSFHPKNMLLSLSIGVVVMFAGIVVIYSIFYISIVNRIRYFGQLRTIGTTGKQIRKIVQREGTLLFCVGAPFGLAIGSLFAGILNPEGWSWIQLLIWGGLVVIVEYIAVLYSVGKPAIMAGKISPIEASRTKGVLQSTQISTRQLIRITPFSMARMSIARNRKKFLMTSFSLAISGILFMVGSIFLSSFDQEAYARTGILKHGEVRIYLSGNAAQSNEHGYAGVQNMNPISEALLQEISLVDGVKDITTFQKLYCTFEYNGRRDKDFAVPFSEAELNSLSKYMDKKERNFSNLVKNKVIFVLKNDAVEEIYGWKFQTGDTVKLEWFNGVDYQTDTFTIGGEIVDEKAYSDPECFPVLGAASCFLLPEKLLDSMLSEYYSLHSDVLLSTDWDTKETEITQQLNAIIAHSENLQMRTLRDSIHRWSGMYDTLFVSIIGISVFIMMFSSISLINTLITNIMTRKQELSVLQSIGMTKRQLNKMLYCEAGWIAVWNIFITLLLGGILGFLLIRGLHSVGMSYLLWNYPIRFSVLYAVVVLVMPVIITKTAMLLLQRKPIVERLREVE